MKVIMMILSFLTTLSASALTVGAYNIRNFDYDQRARIQTNKSELATLLLGLKADVLSVGEINNTREFETFLAAKLPQYGFGLSRCGGAHSQHLGFIYHKNTIELLAFSEDLRLSQPGGRGTCDANSRPLAMGLFKIKSTGQRFYGMSAHLKSGSAPESIAMRIKQYAIIHSIIKDLQSNSGVKDYFLAGDLNTTEFLSRGVDYQHLTKLVASLGLVNLTQNASCSAYWWGGSDDGVESPALLDHVIVSPGLIKRPIQARVHGHCQKVNCREVPVGQLGVSYAQVSDHCPVTAVIQ
ncbi:MAG TPA: endonuclease/exonuclease/phosphatase family protein [Bacteriovoracaceae bacterium]|nr:endonuclease/exonuclease/phosphatase family protein [Bacteriovoracaceae bacterium]